MRRIVWMLGLAGAVALLGSCCKPAAGASEPSAAASEPAAAAERVPEGHGEHRHGEHVHGEGHGHGEHGHGEHSHGEEHHGEHGHGEHGHGEHAHGEHAHQHGAAGASGEGAGATVEGAGEAADAPAKPLGHTFEDAQAWARRFDDPGRKAWQKPAHVVEVMGVAPGMVVADIGAGTGYFLPQLSKAVGAEGRVLGLDIEPDMVAYMTERARRENLTNVEARKVEVADPGLAAGSVDRVLLVNTWHHVPERGAYASKLAAALKPGGHVYIVDYTMETPYGPPKSHRLAATAVLAELKAAGLTAELVKETLPRQYIVRFR